MSVVVDAVVVSRCKLHERLNGHAKPRRSDRKAQDAAVLPRIQRVGPGYGYRRITALVNRELETERLERVNHKRVCRSWPGAACCRCATSERVQDGKVVTIRSNLRWCSDGFGFDGWNGDVIRAGGLRIARRSSIERLGAYTE
ncbi:MAG: hypothetical protein AAF982_04780 [Pseudomonadota bacterium]